MSQTQNARGDRLAAITWRKVIFSGAVGSVGFVIFESLAFLFGIRALEVAAIVSLMIFSVPAILYTVRTRLLQPIEYGSMGGLGGYRAYLGFGVAVTGILAIPGLLLAFIASSLLSFLFSQFLPWLWVFAAVVAAWIYFVGRAFVPVRLIVGEEGLTIRFRNARRSVFRPWGEVKLFQIVGPFFRLGSRGAFPFSWIIVRHHEPFLRESALHVPSIALRKSE